MSAMEVIKNQKGKDQIYFQGYFYNRDKNVKEGIAWRCAKRGCKGRIKTGVEYENGTEPTVLNGHEHPAEPEAVAAKKSVQKMKEKAKAGEASTRSIIQAELSQSSQEAIASIGSRANLTRRLNYSRNVVFRGWKLPATIREVIIPEELKQTLKGARFLLHDSFDSDDGTEETRIFIFGTHEFLDVLLRLV